MKKTDKESICFSYKGSGTYWKRHLAEHGSDMTTEIIFRTSCVDEFSKFALNKSIELGVPGAGWVNIIPESGPGIKMTPEQAVLFSLKIKGIQQGRSMKERLAYDYIDSRRGKKLVDIIRSGKHSQQKPFKIILNDNERIWIFNNEREFQEALHMHAAVLQQIKRNGYKVVKHLKKNTKHSLKKGDKLSYVCLGDNCHRYKNTYRDITLYVNGVIIETYVNINQLRKFTGISLYLFLKHVKGDVPLIAANDIGRFIKSGDRVAFDCKSIIVDNT